MENFVNICYPSPDEHYAFFDKQQINLEYEPKIYKK